MGNGESPEVPIGFLLSAIPNLLGICRQTGCLKVRRDNSLYCEQHTCHANECFENTSRDTHYCVNHACQTKDCDKQAHPNFKYCFLHVCNDKQCPNEATLPKRHCSTHACHNSECDKMPAKGSKYCKQHTCYVNECFEKTIRDTHYCVNHACQTKDCDKQAHPNFKYCFLHVCNDKQCPNEATLPKRHCSTHACHNSECDKMPAKGSKYCEQHTCHVNECLEKTIRDTHYCVNHACQTKDCDKKAHSNFKYCVLHVCNKKQCPNEATLQKPYCQKHACQFGNCPGASNQSGSYCDLHACSLKSCRKEKHRDFRYCLDHICKAAICNEVACLPRVYCWRHACANRECDEGVFDSGKYCKIHTCKEKDCLNAADLPKPYCSVHVCPIQDCAMNKLGRRFCSNHSCGVPTCIEPVRTNVGLCPDHLPTLHFTKESRGQMCWPKPRGQADSYKILSWNVNGLRARLNNGFEFKGIYDILCFCEIKMKNNNIDDGFKKKLITAVGAEYYQHYECRPANGKAGAGIGVLSKCQPIKIFDSQGNDVKGKDGKTSDNVEWDDTFWGRLCTLIFTDFILVVCYAPFTGCKKGSTNKKEEESKIAKRLQWQKLLSSHIANLEDNNKPIIVCGDLNVDYNDGESNEPGKRREEIEAHKQLMIDCKLEDVFKDQPTNTTESKRLDYFLVTRQLAKRVRDKHVLKERFGSDHYPIMIDIKMPDVGPNLLLAGGQSSMRISASRSPPQHIELADVFLKYCVSWNTLITLGTGMRIFKQPSLSIAQYKNIEENVAPMSDLHFVLIQTSEEKTAAFLLVGQMAAKYAIVSLSGLCEITNKLSITSTRIYMLIISSCTNKIISVKDPELADGYRTFEDNWNILHPIATHYVAGIIYGGLFFGQLEVTTQTQEEMKAVSAELSIAISDFKISGKIDWSSKTKLTQCRTESQMYSLGCNTMKPVISIEDLFSQYTEWRNHLGSGTAIAAIVNPMGDLPYLRNPKYVQSLQNYKPFSQLHTKDGTYMGEVSDKKPHGYGQLVYKDGTTRYTGSWKWGLKDGKGIIIIQSLGSLFRTDGSYEGDWTLDHMQGIGNCLFSRQGCTKGVLNSMKGRFRTIYSMEKVIRWINYIGELRTFEDNYIGSFRNGYRNGQGNKWHFL